MGPRPGAALPPPVLPPAASKPKAEAARGALLRAPASRAPSGLPPFMAVGPACGPCQAPRRPRPWSRSRRAAALAPAPPAAALLKSPAAGPPSRVRRSPLWSRARSGRGPPGGGGESAAARRFRRLRAAAGVGTFRRLRAAGTKTGETSTPLRFFFLSPQNLRFCGGPAFSSRRKRENGPCTVQKRRKKAWVDPGRFLF